MVCMEINLEIINSSFVEGFYIPKNISYAPHENYCYLFTNNGQFEIGGVTIPAYSKGIFIASSDKDAAIFALDLQGKFYTAFRNNKVWLNGRVF